MGDVSAASAELEHCRSSTLVFPRATSSISALPLSLLEGELLLARGKPLLAMQLLEPVQAMAIVNPDLRPHQLIPYERALALACWRMGDLEGARAGYALVVEAVQEGFAEQSHLQVEDLSALATLYSEIGHH